MLFRSLAKTSFGLIKTTKALRQPIYRFSQNHNNYNHDQSQIYQD
jgi:hypothetical protein